MCGIAGLFSPSADAPRLFERSLLKRMTDAIAHRGPDDEGFLIEPHVALGHRRLSIIDIATGHQPIFNEDGSVAVVYNGEIYNYRELASELEAADTGKVVKLLEMLEDLDDVQNVYSNANLENME